MLNAEFNKETFKNSVKENVKMLYRKNLEEASQQEIYQAVCYAVKDVIIDNWLKTQKAMDEQDPKILYYMSMEFLMGRALGNNLINLTAYKQVQEALDEMGLNLNLLEDQERDPALETAVLAVWQHASWIPWLHWDIRHTAAVSVINTVCSNSRSATVIR